MSNKKRKSKNSNYHYSEIREREEREKREEENIRLRAKKQKGYIWAAVACIVISITTSLLGENGILIYGDFIGNCFACASLFLIWYYMKDKRKGVAILSLIFAFVTLFLTISIGLQYANGTLEPLRMM